MRSVLPCESLCHSGQEVCGEGRLGFYGGVGVMEGPLRNASSVNKPGNNIYFNNATLNTKYQILNKNVNLSIYNPPPPS